MNRTLYFFTNSFPYNTGEVFIETEIIYLSKAFEEVRIIPLIGNQKARAREVPSNCFVANPIIQSRIQHYFLGILGFKATTEFIPDFMERKVFTKRKWFKQFIINYCTTNNILHSSSLNRTLKSIEESDIMYFYWGKGLANLLPFVIPMKTKKIVRFHGGDLYDENYGGYIPIHRSIIRNADLLVFISKHGQNYLRSRYSEIAFSSVVSYLGTGDYGVTEKSKDGIYRLLSCSNVIPLKRVHRIYEALELITDLKIEWSHIGDGTEYDNLKRMVQHSRGNVRIKLLGRIPNQDVIKYYKQNPVDAFINVSSTEGLPVSLMEAISFNVPVVATDVGGTSEIVNSKTGILLNANPTALEIADALRNVLYEQYQPRSFWENSFSAERNYPAYINQVLLANAERE